MTTTRPALTPAPWPPSVEPTVDEVLPWFLEQTTEAQAWLMTIWREHGAVSRRCYERDHERRMVTAERQVKDLLAARSKEGIQRLMAATDAFSLAADETKALKDRVTAAIDANHHAACRVRRSLPCNCAMREFVAALADPEEDDQ